MRKIYYADSKSIIAERTLEELTSEMPEAVLQRALRYRFDRDAYNFVLGRILLQKGLREFGLSDDLSKISFQENGKPELEAVFFNISHSDHLVVCVLSTDGDIGIDVEVRNDKIELSNFVDYFTEVEWSDIMSSNDSIERFYFYWTRKEAVIKALGVNLAWLHEIELDAKGKDFLIGERNWKLEEIAIDLDLASKVYCVLCG